MANLSTKINLAGLTHARMHKKKKNGELTECLVIPIKENHLFIGEKGIYMELSHFEIKNPKEGQKGSHLVKQSLPTEVFNAMSEEERKSIPVMGETRTWESSNNEPKLSQEVLEEDDDLPF